ncbi:MAG: GIY-YIG nuclease family protein [Proteobacteria bacterium]|nr:GIY-YIG nuclease family protein [Pseudomonadota bacterium]
MNVELTATCTNWTVYIILCSDNSLYTGITNNLSKRFRRHCGTKGAKYFRGRQPVKVVYAEISDNRSAASKREFAIKQLSHAEKVLLIQSVINNIESVF